MRAALCVLALLAGACATQSEECYQPEWIAYELLRPKMTVNANTRFCPDKYGACTIPYGGDTTVTILCSSDDARNLYMHLDENHLETKQLNSTTIQLTIQRMQEDSVGYYCKDRKSNCENKVYVNVDIMMSVVSTTDYYVSNDDDVDYYFVIYNNSYDVFCRAKDSTYITIKTFKSQQLPLEILNATTAKVTRQADHIGEELYRCKDNRTVPTKIKVVVDYHPEAKNVQCMIYNMLKHKCSCSWTSSSKRNNSTLFYIPLGILINDPQLICTNSLGDTTLSCSWNKESARLSGRDYSLRLLLQTCNEFYCSNQTFKFNPEEITRTDAINGLRLVNKSSRGVDLAWRAHFQFRDYDYDYDDEAWLEDVESIYKIQYRVLSAEWRHADSSSVGCGEDECKYHLELPCPDWRYEVRVYVKLKKAKGDRFWSEPASLHVVTEPQETGTVNPECYVAIPEPEPISNVAIALNEIDKLRREIMNDKIAKTKKKRDMKLKVAEVKRLRELLAALDAE